MARAYFAGQLPDAGGISAWETLTVTMPRAVIKSVRFSVQYSQSTPAVYGLFDNLKYSAQDIVTNGSPSWPAWSAAADFGATNPSGVWSYRYRVGSAAPVLMPFKDVNCTGIPGVACWVRDPSGFDLPMVGQNTTSAPVSFANVVIPRGTLNLHPGPTGEQAIVTFTVPTAGTYRFSGLFQVIDRVTSGVKVNVAVDGVSVDTTFPKALSSFAEAKVFDVLRSGLIAGQQVDFVVDPNGSYNSDSTELTVGVVKIGP